MTIPEALDLVVARTGHTRYRDLLDPGHSEYNPDYEPVVLRMAAELAGEAPPADYPPLVTQAANLAGAVGRAVGAAIRGDAVTVPDDVLAERKAICAACHQFDACASRCRLCGCYTKQKQRLATERCPLDPPRWNSWEKPANEIHQ